MIRGWRRVTRADHSRVGLAILCLYNAVRLEDWAETLGRWLPRCVGELGALSWLGRNSGVDMTCLGKMVSCGTEFNWYIYCASVSMLPGCM